MTDKELKTQRQTDFLVLGTSQAGKQGFLKILGKDFPRKTLLDEHKSFIFIPTDAPLGIPGVNASSRIIAGI